MDSPDSWMGRESMDMVFSLKKRVMEVIVGLLKERVNIEKGPAMKSNGIIRGYYFENRRSNV